MWIIIPPNPSSNTWCTAQLKLFSFLFFLFIKLRLSTGEITVWALLSKENNKREFPILQNCFDYNATIKKENDNVPKRETQVKNEEPKSIGPQLHAQKM